MASSVYADNARYDETNLGTNTAKWVKSLTQSRLSNFLGGRYADVNLSAVLDAHRLDDDAHVKLAVWSAPKLSRPLFKEAMQQKFRAAKKGDKFGPSCACSC